MFKIIFSKRKLYVFVCAAVSLTLGLLFIVITMAIGRKFYEKVIYSKKPSLRSMAVEHYRETFNYLDKAIFFSPGNALYYATKGDRYFEALRQGFRKDLNIYIPDIIGFYSRSLQLNPASYAYNKKLAAFSVLYGSNEASAIVLRSIAACPKCYTNYVELSGYYFDKGLERQGSFLFLSLMGFDKDFHAGERGRIFRSFKKRYGDKLDNVYFWDKHKRMWSLVNVFEPKTAIFDFKENGFPAIKVCFDIRVFLNENSSGVILYRNRTPYKYLKTVVTRSGEPFHEAKVATPLPEVALNELRVEVEGAAVIDKIEIAVKPFCNP
jgi:hypothetical protein